MALTELRGHQGSVNSAAFSADGVQVVTASSDGTARIWNVSSLEKGDAFTIACARLGNNTSLTGLAKRYGLGELKPICADHSPHLVDWSKIVD